ncbi:TonB-dependent receptor [Ensifer adhaerens]|uniref:TonB-dependent receptor n=1 Tax=Ensifer adhaerens TaxID=106592 RepID=UPI003D087347
MKSTAVPRPSRREKNNLKAILASVSALALSLPSTAHGQEKTKRVSTDATPLERIVVTAPGKTKRVLDVPQSISVISREDIEDRNIGNIQDLVRHEPGVSVKRYASVTNPWGQNDGFTIRGTGGNRILLTVDGSRVQEGSAEGSRDFFDMSNIKSVEIVRGPNSVLLGADALGGAVMFKTLDPSDLLVDPTKPWAVEVSSGYNSYDNSWRKQVTAAYDFGDIAILGSYGQVSSSEAELGKARADGGIWGCQRRDFPCNRMFPADSDTGNAFAKVVWTPDAAHTFKLTGELFSRDTQVDQRHDTLADFGLPPMRYLNASWVRDLEMSRKRVALEHDWQVGAAWLDSVNWNVSWSPQKRVTDSLQRRVFADRFETHAQFRDYRETFLQASVRMQSSFDLGPAHHTLTYGFDGSRTKGDYTGINNIYNSRNGRTTTETNAGFSFPRFATERADFYLEDRIEFLDGRLTVNPGIRLAHHSIDPTGDGSYSGRPGFEPRKHEHTELLKRIGAIFKFDETYSVYASYGEGVKLPTSVQLFQSNTDPITGWPIVPNPNLKPESVSSYEVGLRGELDRGYFTVAGFYADYANFIRSRQAITIPGPGGRPIPAYTSLNVEDVSLWGMEFGGAYEVLENTTVSANITWTKGRQRASAGAATTAFDGSTPFTAVLGLKHELPDYGLGFEVFGTFAAGRTESSQPNYFLPPGYAVFDAYAKWAPRENFELTAGIENIFDRRYFPNTLADYPRTTTNNPIVNKGSPLELQTAPGRVFKLGAKIRF